MNISFKFFLILYMELDENFVHLFSHSTLTALRTQKKWNFKHLPNTSLLRFITSSDQKSIAWQLDSVTLYAAFKDKADTMSLDAHS